MKEATGELNMTVVTIVAVGALATFFYLVIWPTIKNNMTLTSACNASSNGTVKYEDDNVSCQNGKCTMKTGSKASRVCNNSK